MNFPAERKGRRNAGKLYELKNPERTDDNLYQYDAYAQSQIITRNPILKEPVIVQRQYYNYLRRLIYLANWGRGKYVKAQLSFYEHVLCNADAGKQNKVTWDLIHPFCCLIPFDVIAILSFRKKNLLLNKLARITDTIMLDFGLPAEDRELLKQEFDAAQGNRQAWQQVLRKKSLKHYIEYLRVVESNIIFANMRPYEILITATMSAGKSTLINALAGKNITLTQNMACTSKIHTIVSKSFEDDISTEYDYELSIDASKEDLLTDNSDNMSTRIIVGTYFDGSLGGQRIILYDSPGVNSSENFEHTEITGRMLQSKKYKLLVYVLNATQLGTTDEEQHLDLVAKTIGRRNILFVMNKIDHLNAEDESLPDVIMRQKEFLRQKGFKSPIICPVSARAAYFAKKGKKEPLSRLERRELESYADIFAQGGLPEYYEKEMGCPPISDTGDEIDDLYRDCGLAYLENIIIQYKKER